VPTNYIELHGVKVVTAENPSGNSSYVVDLTGDHIVFRNNEVTYSGDVVSSYNSSGYRTRGIVLAGAYVTVDSNYVRGMCEGIASSGGSPRYHTIRGNTVNASAWNGLLQLATTDGSTAYLGVLWEGNDVDTCYGEDCLQFQQNYDGAVNLNRNRGTVVRGNRFRRAGENLIDLKGAGRVVIEGNVMFTADGDDDGAFAGDQPWSGPGIERGNPAQGVEDRYTTVRGNVIGDASSGRTMATIGSQDANNLYINNRRRLNVSNTSDSTYELKGILVEGNDVQPRMILNDLFVGQPNWVNLYLYNMDGRSTRFDLDHNLYYDSATTARFYHRKTSGATAKVYGLTAWRTALSNSDYSYITGREQHSLSSNPTFASMPLRAYGYNPSWDWSLAAGSPAIGSARCWAFTSASGTGTTIPVTNAYIWSDGFGIVQGDSVKIGSNIATYITSSNPSSETITVAASQTYSSGDSVYFVVNGGVLRNLGPYNVASVTGGGDPGAPPDAPANIAPANGTSTTSPVTFRWTSEAGASSYYLCVSPDGWNTLIVSQSALTDTFYTVSLPQGGSYIWNVSASNAYGRSSWSSDWTFTTNVVSAFRDTVTLSWNNIKHSRTLDTNTTFQFSNLQRRDIQVALRNPNGKEVSWLGVTWITAQPPTIPPAQSWYQFFWDGGDSVLGSYINNSSIATLTWGAITGSISGNATLSDALDNKMETSRLALNAANYGLSASASASANSAALDLACAAARTTRAGVYIPRGVYNISKRLILDWDGACLVGDGIGQTVLRRSSDFNVFGTYTGFNTLNQIGAIVYVTRASNVTISGITVDANYSVTAGGSGTGNGIAVDSTFNALVTNCQVKNITGHTYGIWVRRSQRFAVTNNIVSGDRANTYAPPGYENMNELIEVSQGNTEDGIVSGNVLSNSSNSGVLIYDYQGYVRNIVVSGNTISKCGIGVAVDKLDSVNATNGVTVSGNMLDSCTVGIRSTAESFNVPQRNVAIRGNTIRRSTEAMNVIHTIGVEITENIIDTVYSGGSSLAAIWCYNDTSVTIRGNTIRYAPGKYGISLNSTNRHAIVENNLLQDAGRTGIYLSADYVHVAGNYVLNANLSGETSANVGSGIALESVDSALVQSNTVIDTRTPRLMVSNIYLNGNTGLSVTNNRLNGNTSGQAIKTDNTNTGRISLNDGHLGGAFVNGTDYAVPDSMVTTDGVNARGIRIRSLSNQRIPLVGADGSIISRPDMTYDNSVPLYLRQKTNLPSGVVQIVLRDTAAMASGVGGAIGLGGQYTSGGSETDFAWIRGKKANGTSGELQGEIGFYTRRAAEGYDIRERWTIDSTGDLRPKATGTYDLGAPPAWVDSAFVEDLSVTRVNGFAPTLAMSAQHSWTDSLDAATGTGAQKFATKYTIPANYITSTTCLRVTALVKYTATATVPNTTTRLYIGGTSVCPSTAAALPAGTYHLGLVYYIHGTAVPGGSVAVEVNPLTAYSGTSAYSRFAGGRFNLATNGTLDVEFSIQFAATTAGNNMVLRQLIVETVTP
jgi:hypothetical protein